MDDVIDDLAAAASAAEAPSVVRTAETAHGRVLIDRDDLLNWLCRALDSHERVETRAVINEVIGKLDRLGRRRRRP